MKKYEKGVKMEKKIVLIDGNSILNRAFYGVPILTNAKGIQTNAVFGFLNILFKVLEEEQADYLTVAFDVKHPTFRHEMYADYKGTRKPTPEELLQQLPMIKNMLKAMNIKIVERPGYEADDILGTIARQCEKEDFLVSLVSGDRDLLQIASEKIKIRIPKTKQGKTEVEDYNTKDVVERYGITPSQIIDLKGLMGDTSDNIPGVPSIGEKTAIKILSAFGSVENAFAHIDEVMPNRAREALIKNYDLAILSKKLATIKTDCELNYNITESKITNFYTPEAYELCKELNFRVFLKKFEEQQKPAENNRLQEIEKSFQIIEDKERAEQVFLQLQEKSKEKDLVIGCQLLQKTKEELEHPMESNGQYSLFGIEEKDAQEAIIGLSITEQDSTYFIKTTDHISGTWLISQWTLLLKSNVILSILDLKSIYSYLKEFGTKKCFDCGVAAYLLNPLKESYNYEVLAKDYFDLSLPSYQQLFAKKVLKEIKDTNEYNQYACYKAYMAYHLYEKLRKKLEESSMIHLYEEIELPLVETLYDMETRGIKVNKEELEAYGKRLSKQIINLEQEIYEMVQETFNINSPKQLGVILFEKLQLPFAKKTKTGYSTSADILEKLKEKHPVVEKILEYRQLSKLKSTYADGLAVYIEKDGRIHSKFNQTITATGRISSTEPNLQNIPIRMELGREIRKAFIPKEGYLFLDADYSQIELRVLAHMSGDEKLIVAYKEAQDIHQITASEVFHIPMNQVTSLQRRNAKAVNFGIVYGISSFSLGQDLDISKKEAEEYIHKYFETYPKVKIFLDELVESGKKDGYVETLFQRKRPIPELKSSNYMQRAFGERIAMNSPIQGTAADIIKIAMIRVNRRLKDENLQSQLLLQIHDELLIETKEEEVEQVQKILEEEMRSVVSLSVPLEISVDRGKSWYEAH